MKEAEKKAVNNSNKKLLKQKINKFTEQYKEKIEEYAKKKAEYRKKKAEEKLKDERQRIEEERIAEELKQQIENHKKNYSEENNKKKKDFSKIIKQAKLEYNKKQNEKKKDAEEKLKGIEEKKAKIAEEISEFKKKTEEQLIKTFIEYNSTENTKLDDDIQKIINVSDTEKQDFLQQITELQNSIDEQISVLQDPINIGEQNKKAIEDYEKLKNSIQQELSKPIKEITKLLDSTKNILNCNENDKETILKELNKDIMEMKTQKATDEDKVAQIIYVGNKLKEKEGKERFTKSIEQAEQNFDEQFKKIDEFDLDEEENVDSLEFYHNETTSYEKNILPFINNVSRKAQDVEDAINTLNVLMAKKMEQYSTRNLNSNGAKIRQINEVNKHIKQFQDKITSINRELASLSKKASEVANDISGNILQEQEDKINKLNEQQTNHVENKTFKPRIRRNKENNNTTLKRGQRAYEERINRVNENLKKTKELNKYIDDKKQQTKKQLKKQLNDLKSLLQGFLAFKELNYDKLVKDLNEYDEKEKNNTTQSANKNNTNNSMSQTTNEIIIDPVNRNGRMKIQNLGNITIEKVKNITPNTATLDTRKSNNEMKKDVNINQNITIEKNNNDTNDDKQPVQYDDKMLTALLEALKNNQNQNQNELSREVLVKILSDVITKQNSQKQNSVSPKIKVSPKISGSKNTINDNKTKIKKKIKSKKRKNNKKKSADANQTTSGKISTSSQTTESVPNSNTPQNSFEEKQGYYPYPYNTRQPRYYQDQRYVPENQPQYYPPYLRDRPVYYEEYLPRQTYASQYLPNNAYYYEEYIPEQAFITRNPQQYDIIWPQPPKQQLPDCNYVSYSMTHGNRMSMPQSIYNKSYMPISSSLKDNSKLINKDTFSDVAHNYKK